MSFREQFGFDLNRISYHQFVKGEAEPTPNFYCPRNGLLRFPLDPLDTRFNPQSTDILDEAIQREVIIYNQISDNFPSRS